ncbi:hypothetical protein L195_g037356 [Trifolium pratense]|uniref:Uncharacterized protein n=1 Tax=Trifolium pratense TaxID=57577 RepID=A0A2K3LS19_TRIPR|nr:hypothetical protein L195_g037356 [Trifolium pratense]
MVMSSVMAMNDDFGDGDDDFGDSDDDLCDGDEWLWCIRHVYAW